MKLISTDRHTPEERSFMKTTLSTINPYIGQRIRLERKRLGISQETLASDLNVSVNYIGAIERGKRLISQRLAQKLCAYFHLTLDYLYHGFSPDMVAEQSTYGSDPYREWLQLMEFCSEQEVRLCLDVIKPVLVIWRNNLSALRDAEINGVEFHWIEHKQPEPPSA